VDGDRVGAASSEVGLTSGAGGVPEGTVGVHAARMLIRIRMSIEAVCFMIGLGGEQEGAGMR